MTALRRRSLIGSGAGLLLPRFAIAQADSRPVIRIAVQLLATSGTLDPLAEQSNVEQRIVNSYLECLIGKNYMSKLESIPLLATAWRRIDARTVELDIRPGVKFHNGDELTAEDVAFSYGSERMFGSTAPIGLDKTLTVAGGPPKQGSKVLPPQVAPVARRLWPSLEKVEIISKYVVRFVNATPDLTLEGRLTAQGSEIINRRGFEEAATWLDYGRKPVGTGPYRVASFRPNQELVFEAHDAYWGGRPPIRELRFIEVPEVANRVNGLRAGDYQFICDLPPDQIKTVEAEPKLHVVGGLIPNHRITVFAKYDTVLRDPRVRQAMTHAIDRKTIVDSLWLGRTRVPAGLQWEHYDYMYQADWTVPEFNQARARELLKAAGYKGEPIPYRLLNDYYTNQTATAQAMVEMWSQVGLNVEIQMKENWTQIWDRAGQRAVHEWSNSAVFNDPVSSIVAQHGPNGQQQQTEEWTNAEMNQLSGRLTTSTDKDERRRTFRRMLEICEREDPAYTVLHQNATFTGKQRGMKWRVSPDFGMDFRAHNWGDAVREG